MVWNDLYFTEVIILSGTSLELAAVTQLQWLQCNSLYTRYIFRLRAKMFVIWKVLLWVVLQEFISKVMPEY